MKNLLLILIVSFCFVSQAQTPAFQGAEGYGKYSQGGRGGTIISVTHLKDHHIITQWRDDSEPSGSRVKTFANIAGDNLPDVWKTSVGLDVNTSYSPYDSDVSGDSRLNIEICQDQINQVIFDNFGNDDNDYAYFVPDTSSPFYDGSLRKAIDNANPRTVIFKVGGILDIKSPLEIKNNNITIAGQTAPGDGIMLINSNATSKFTFEIDADDVIIRFLTFRRSESSSGYNAGDNIWVNKGKNIIVDHCSLSWSSDGNLDIANYNYDYNNRVTDSVTVQYCLFTNSYGGNNKSMLITGSPPRLSLWRNAFINSATRNPSLSSESGHNYTFDGVFELVNNFWHDCGNGASAGNVSTTNFYEVNFVNNVRTAKVDSGTSQIITNSIRFFRIGDGTDNGSSSERERIYSLGNFDDSMMSAAQESDPEYRMVQFGKNSSNNTNNVPSYMRSSVPFDTPIIKSGIPLWDNSEIETNLLPVVGNYKYRDSEDDRAMSDVANREGTDNVTDNTFPEYNDGTPYTDSDNDGMADSWENSEFGNLSKDGTDDTDSNGYSDFEDFLGYLADDLPVEAGCSVDTVDNIFINPCFSTDGTIDSNSYPLGWWSIEGAAEIIDGQLHLTKLSSEANGRTFATNGTNSDVVETGKEYELTYEVISDEGAGFRIYYDGGYKSPPSTVGVHTINFVNTGSSGIFVFRVLVDDATIVLDNVVLKEIPCTVDTQDNLVVNPCFLDSTGWTLQGDWTISNGKLNAGANSGGTAMFQQGDSYLTEGSTYLVEFDKTGSGWVQIRLKNAFTDALIYDEGEVSTTITAGNSFDDIRIFAQDGVTLDNIKITEVVQNIPVTGVNGLPDSITLTEGQNYQFNAIVEPNDATDTTVVWSRSNTSFGTISQTGLFTASEAGQVSITVTTNDGSFTDTSTVNITSINTEFNNTMAVKKQLLINN
ncbi:Ig-like domain-containing protein [Winogradskyella luteola]|uniref:Ig-like domain-containing protein n=1 Tax=Winogradskyella luteola TaxID=2828330 RepID=A0A9X1JMJ1_9FLAO|nr:Ig-like domain-containing protein [Winogradskyella luteola]MBV7268361.1 Ig-like domain-containing protein [Winogradskyella luteola]